MRSSVLPPSITAAEGCAETDENLKTLFAKAPLVSFHDLNHYLRPTRAKGVLVKGVRTLESRLHQRVMVLMYGPQWREVLKARLDDDEDQDAEESVEDEQQAESTGTVLPAQGYQVPTVRPAVEESAARPSLCLLYTSPSPRDVEESRMPSSA